MKDEYKEMVCRVRFIDGVPAKTYLSDIEIVRCKDCKYYQKGKKADDWLWCMMNHHYTDEEKYCAWAERKTE